MVPEIGEYERTSTTVINASLLPLVRSYLGSLRTKLADIGVTGRLLVMQSHGGIAGDRAAAMRPAYIVESGPAAGAIAAAAGRYTPCSSHTRWAVRSRCGASRATGLTVARDMQAFVEVLNPSRAGVSEVVIPPASNVAGRTIRDVAMRRRRCTCSATCRCGCCRAPWRYSPPGSPC